MRATPLSLRAIGNKRLPHRSRDDVKEEWEIKKMGQK
jgi:hypothetical protein